MYFNNLFRKGFGLLITSVLFFSITISFAYADSGVPSILSYQGRLTDSSGNLLGGAGTPYFFRFSFWDSATVGSGTQVWPVTSPTAVSLTVKQGVFNVNIGDVENSYPDILNYNFGSNKKIYLQVETSANNSSFETLSPRQRITSAPFAEVAGSLAPDYLTSIFSNYFTKTESNNLYDFLGAASTTASTTIANHENIFNHNLISTALQSFTESDPFWSASSWASTTNNSADWNTAFSWGNHAGLYDLLGTASTTASSKQNVLNGTGFVKANGTSITYDNNTYLTAETDPLFTAWDKHAGISITESQISDLQSYITSSALTPYALLDGTNQPFTGIITVPSLVTTVGGLTLLVGQDIRPSADSTTAINIAQADGTDFVTFDTTNKRVGIGTTAPVGLIDINGGDGFFGDTANTARVLWFKRNNVNIGGISTTNAVLSLFGGTSATSQLAITSLGNVGIWTSAATSNFQVNQFTSGIGTVSVGAGGTAWTGVGTQFLNTFKVGDTITSEGQTLTIATISSNTALTTNAVGAAISAKAYTLTGGTRFSVLGNGNVGIGTTAPASLLHIEGAGATISPGVAFLTLKNTHGTSNDQFGINFTNTTYAGTARINSLLVAGGATSELHFYTGGATPTDRVVISGTGNVGIGTASPASTNSGLDIASGGLSLVLGADNVATTRTNATTKYGRIGAYHYTNTEEPMGVLLTDSTATESNLHWGGGSGLINAATTHRFYTAANTTTTTGTERMRINSSGNVGIGTTTPGQALTVVGNGQFTAVGSGAFSSDLSLTADGTLTTSASDLALKMNLVPLNATTTSTSSISILDKVIGLKPYTFNWISDPTGSKDIGLIAQDLEEIFPEITFTNKTDGYKGINYSRLSVILVSAIQELNDKIVKMGSYVVDGVANFTSVIATKFTGQEAEITNIKTEQICIGETCIDEAMLKEIILKNSIMDTTTEEEENESDTSTSTATTTDENTATTTEEIILEEEATSTDPVIEDIEATSTDPVIEEVLPVEITPEPENII